MFKVSVSVFVCLCSISAYTYFPLVFCSTVCLMLFRGKLLSFCAMSNVGGETVSHMGEKSKMIVIVLFGWGGICGHLHLITFKCQGQSRYCRSERENKTRRKKKVPYMANTSPSNQLCLQPNFPWHTLNSECKCGIAARVCVSGYVWASICSRHRVHRI